MQFGHEAAWQRGNVIGLFGKQNRRISWHGDHSSYQSLIALPIALLIEKLPKPYRLYSPADHPHEGSCTMAYPQQSLFGMPIGNWSSVTTGYKCLFWTRNILTSTAKPKNIIKSELTELLHTGRRRRSLYPCV